MTKPLVQSTGRRKEAVARVRLRNGEGKITINGREVEAKRLCGLRDQLVEGALGLGLDRVAMNKYGIPNIRSLFESDERLLRPESPILSSLNVRYLLVPAGLHPQLGEQFRQVYQSDEVRVYENVLAYPRAYFADSRPAATMMVVGLATPEMKIEIEVTALTPEEEGILRLRLEQARAGQVVDADEVFKDLDRIIEEAEQAR